MSAFLFLNNMLPFKKIDATGGLMRQVKIEGIREETHDAKTFVLKPLQGEIAYRAGQFLTFVFIEQHKQERRSYSISSSPEWDEPLAVTVKRLPNGAFSRPLLDKAETGDVLTIAGGASGFFTLPDKQFDHFVFIAAGSGITPVFSLLKSAQKLYPKVPALLIYSNRSRDRTIFRNHLKELEARYASLQIEWLFSSDQDLLRTRLTKSLLKELLNRHVNALPERICCFTCGPFEFMRMTAIVLQSEGIPAANIKREVFSPEAPVTAARPPDVAKHKVEIVFQGKKHILDVQYPESILAVAKRQGIDLPYSCEAGRCGSCVASCKEGSVWMKYNEVLTDREVEKGRVLICNGFPVGGDVRIEFDS